MTPAEFKAWLDGYLDGKDGLTADQVGAVKAKLATVQPEHHTDFGKLMGPNLPNSFPSIPDTNPYPDWLRPNMGVSSGSQAIVNGHHAGPSD